jgi:hypothetical protein
MRRWLLVACVALGSIGVTLAACSSFSANDDAPVDGGADALVAADGPAAPPCDTTKLDSDGANCGACGHSCLGGACAAGRCAPVRIGVTDQPVLDVVVDATRVLWTTSTETQGPGRLEVCPKAGCNGGIPTVVAAGVNTSGLASDGVTAYASFLTSTRKVVRVEANDTLTKLPLADHVFPGRLAVRPEGLYVVSYYEPDGASYQRSVSLWDTKKESPVGVFSPVDAANTDQFLFTDDRIFLGAHDIGYIGSCAKSSCTSWGTHSTDPDALVGSMTTDGRRIFWTNYGPVHSCPADGAPCTSLTTELGTAQLNTAKALAVTYAAGALYVETSGGDILTCEPTSCASTVATLVHEGELALTYPVFGHTLTADDKAVYWAAVDRDADGGAAYRLMKLAK